MKNKLIVLISGVLVILLMVFGVSFAIFRFGETGTNQELVLGDIWMKYEESNGIQLENVLPGDGYKNYFEFTITGTNTYTKKDIWYDISLVRGDAPSGKVESNRIGDKYLKFLLTEIVDETEDVIFINKTYKDLTNQKIHVDKISKSTNEYSKTYRLYMTISEELTYGNAEGAILTTEEFGKIFGSVKVNVTGDFNEKELPATDINCFEIEPTAIYTQNNNMNSEELSFCESFFTNMVNNSSDYTVSENSTIRMFCEGKGTIEDKYEIHNTLQDYLNHEEFTDLMLLDLLDNNIILKEEGLAIHGYDASCGSDVIIPKEENGYKVLKIGTNAFLNKNLTSVIIPDGIKIIGQTAFKNNFLTTINIPSSVLVIEDRVFYNNNLVNVKLNEGLTTIMCGAFSGNNLSSIDIPNSVINLANLIASEDTIINKRDDLEYKYMCK